MSKRNMNALLGVLLAGGFALNAMAQTATFNMDATIDSTLAVVNHGKSTLNPNFPDMAYNPTSKVFQASSLPLDFLTSDDTKGIEVTLLDAPQLVGNLSNAVVALKVSFNHQPLVVNTKKSFTSAQMNWHSTGGTTAYNNAGLPLTVEQDTGVTATVPGADVYQGSFRVAFVQAS